MRCCLVFRDEVDPEEDEDAASRREEAYCFSYYCCGQQGSDEGLCEKEGA